jgi:hypothetical protein
MCKVIVGYGQNVYVSVQYTYGSLPRMELGQVIDLKV